MGCRNSKNFDEPLPIKDATEYGSEILIENEDKYDKQIINYIKSEIRQRPEIFLLNNLLMSMVFFQNYEKDLYDFSNTAITKEEQELNTKLVKEVKECIISDSLLDKIQENIKFFDKNEECEEQLSSKTIFLVNNNIEVKDRNDVSYYTPLDVPGCHVQLEDYEEQKEENERKGFLKLKVLESSLSKSSKQLSNKNIMKRQTSKPTTPEIENEENSDEYSTITAFNTPKNLNIVKTSGRRDTLPENCFEVRRIRKLNSKINDDDDDDDDEAEEDEESDEDESSFDENELIERENKNNELFENVTYLSSNGFMEYFQNDVFPNTCGKILGFTDEEIHTAQVIPGCILCYKKQQNNEIIHHHIIPSVAIDWPDHATEFIYRKSRNTIIDKRDGVIYRWPTNEMVKELKSLNCVVIPKGFVMKKGENENSDIEWEIRFPKASRYLEMRMSHPQVRCYIFLLALYKNFIEKFTTYHGLLIDHIKTHMFWECEADAKSWPEHKMGIKILQVIEDLNSGLSRSKIPHYFIKEKNIFENIPSKYLQFAQKVFHDILQFPVMHFIEALKNLKYLKNDFYPSPDLNQLEELLTNDQSYNLPISIRIRNKDSKKKKRQSVVQLGNVKNKQKQKIEDLKWKKKFEKSNRKKHLEMLKNKEDEAEKGHKKEDKMKNLKIDLSNLAVTKQISVLEYFIKHFIEIAKKSRKIGPKNQTVFYLKQAWYNVKVLEDIGGVYQGTKEFNKIINKERESLERDDLQERETIAPPTPQRNVEHNLFLFHTNNSRKPSSVTLKKSQSTGGNENSLRKDRKFLKNSRQKSVGFDSNVEKISFSEDC